MPFAIGTGPSGLGYGQKNGTVVSPKSIPRQKDPAASQRGLRNLNIKVNEIKPPAIPVTHTNKINGPITNPFPVRTYAAIEPPTIAPITPPRSATCTAPNAYPTICFTTFPCTSVSRKYLP